MIYFDTSALVKKYIIEVGTDKVRAQLKTEKKVFTSKITYAEVCASFARKQRDNEIEKRQYQKIWRSFTNDWDAIILIEVQEELFSLIRRLVESYPLRGADAIHLSSAIWIGEKIGQSLNFVASDNILLNAARNEGLVVINPEDD